MSDVLDVWNYFPSSVVRIQKPEFLKMVNKVSEEKLKIVKAEKKLDDIYPAYMSANYFNDPRVFEFAKYVAETGWRILADQGYKMDDKEMLFFEMWTQEHYKTSNMEQHTHTGGSQLVGFYFLECPENSSKILIHDPRPAKVQINMDQQDQNIATQASTVINFDAKPGDLYFTNSWLPHSFTRHGNSKPMKFVHFNLGYRYVPAAPPPAEVV
jgi:hypothetical protein